MRIVHFKAKENTRLVIQCRFYHTLGHYPGPAHVAMAQLVYTGFRMFPQFGGVARQKLKFILLASLSGHFLTRKASIVSISEGPSV